MFALAWVGIGDSWIFQGWYGRLAPTDAFPKAKQAIDNALIYDETLGEAHTSRAHIYFEFDHDWDAAEREYERGIALSPGYTSAYHWYGRFLTAMGRHEEARRQLEKARELDPLSLIINTTVALAFYFGGDYELAIDAFQKALELDQDFAPAHWHLGWAFEQSGRHEEAIAEAQRAIDISGGNLVYVASLGHAYAMSGDKAAARKVLDQLSEASTSGHVSAYHVGVIYGRLGDIEQGILWLDRAYDAQSPWIGFLKVDPRVDPFRSHPTFAELLQRANLDP